MVQRRNDRVIETSTGVDEIGWPSENEPASPKKERIIATCPSRSSGKEIPRKINTGVVDPTTIEIIAAARSDKLSRQEATTDVSLEKAVATSQILVQNYPFRAPAIYPALHAIHREIVAQGIGKDRKNTTQNFRFRGIDDAYGSLSPLLVEHQVVTVPRMLERTQTQYNSKQGGNIFDVVVKAEYDFLSLIDGSKVTVAVYGEGMDSADKATAKAMAVAHKYAHFQLFNIPVEAHPELRDPDFESPEIAPGKPEGSPRPAAATDRRPATEKPPAGFHPIEKTIRELLSNEEARTKVRNKVLDAYGVMLLKDVPEDLVDEAVSKVETFVAAAKARADKLAKA